eukprot:430448_1
MSDVLRCWTIGDNKYNQQCYLGTEALLKLKPINPCDKIKNIVSGKFGSTYIISDDGKLIVFGNNDCRQLGITTDTFIYMIISHFTQHLCFIPYDILFLMINFCGNVFSDSFDYNRFDENAHSVPIEIFINEIKLVSNGIAANHKFIITKTNELYGIGCNRYDQLGINSYNDKALNKISFFDNLNVNIVQIECGCTFSMFLTMNGKIYVCGRSYNGALGLGSNVGNVNGFRMIKKIKHLNIKQICSGDEHTLALNENGQLYSWGNGGQLGHGTKTNVWSPKRIKYLEKKVIGMIDCGSDHSVVLAKNGLVFCWGRNIEFQCGNNDNEHVLKPKKNKTLKSMKIVDIKCGYNHTCVKTNDNKYFLWGYNRFNQCLVYNVGIYVKVPTQFDGNNSFSEMISIVAIFPGFDETRVITKHV